MYYFLYIQGTGKMFQWTKPAVREVPGHHAEWILDDIKDLSSWGNEFTFHEPSVTMDDPVFWHEHVLKKEGDRFLFLLPMEWTR